MRRTFVLASLIAVCLQVSAIGAATAQDIVSLNEDGITAFSEGRFADAAEKFGQAYAIKPEPPLKKNEAVAWFKAEKCSEALAAAKEYLALGVDNDLSTREAQTVAVRCYIQRAETELASGNTDSAAAALADARANSPAEEDVPVITKLEAEVTTRRTAATAEAERLRLAAAQAEQDQAALDRQGGPPVLAMGLVGGGAAIVVGTLVYHLALATGTASKFREASAAGDRAEYDKLGKRLTTGNWLIPTLYAVGLATSGVGVYLWWSSGDRETRPATGSLGMESIGVTATWIY